MNEPEAREAQTPLEKNLAEVKVRIDAGTLPEFEPNVEKTLLLPFDSVKIRMLTREGTPVASGVRRIFGFMFEVEAPGVDRLFVKRLRIETAPVTFDYALFREFDLPKSLEIGIGGILQKTVQEHLLVEIVSHVEKV